MTITTCDICSCVIPLTQHTTPSKIEGTARLEQSDKTFTFELNVMRYQFTTTNFALCKSCMVRAVSRAVADMVLAESVKPAEVKPQS